MILNSFSKPNGIDCKRNPITRNDNVKVISGPNKVLKFTFNIK